jgi:TRAP-type C4-dicarboxylate transport system permease small subunit
MPKQKIIKIDAIISEIEKKIIIFLVLAMLVLSSLQIILRIFFHSGISWLDLFLRHLVMITALFSASLVSFYSSHFKIEIFEKLGIDKEIKEYINIISKIISQIAVLIILAATLGFMKMEFDFKSIKLEPQTLNLFLILIFFNMFFHTLASFFKKENK